MYNRTCTVHWIPAPLKSRFDLGLLTLYKLDYCYFYQCSSLCVHYCMDSAQFLVVSYILY